MTERNLCAESGCGAFCCLDPKMHFKKLTRDELLIYWPNAIQTLSISATELFKQKGVYFKKSGRGFTVKIVGYCPNLDERFNCKIRDDKPEACSKFGLGQDDCIAVRLTHFLPPYREWAYKQSILPTNNSL